MLRTIGKILKFCFYAALVALAVTFAVSNRTHIDLIFFPLPYVVSMPIFLFAIVVFTLGILLGWSVARVAGMKRGREHRQVSKRVAALENEIGALRSEQMAKPALTRQ